MGLNAIIKFILQDTKTQCCGSGSVEFGSRYYLQIPDP